MKRHSRILLIFLAALLVLCPPGMKGAQADEELPPFDVYVDGPSEISEGETFTVTFSFTSPSEYDMTAVGADIDYDTSRLEMLGGGASGSMTVTFGPSAFIAYSTDGYDSGSLATVTFRATGAFRPGDVAYVSLTNVTGSTADPVDVWGYGDSIDIGMRASAPSGGEESSSGGEGSGQSSGGSQSQALPSESTLKELTVSGCTLSPAFSPDVITYSLTAPYNIDRLDIKAVPTDPAATVVISDTALSADEAVAVTVTVTAQNGSRSVYTINAEKSRDPNYVASDNCYLKSLSVEGLSLSPLFSRDIYRYVAYAPADLSQVKIDAVAEHPGATVKTLGSADTYPGRENVYSVVVTAEDGKTTGIYYVTVVMDQNYDFYLKKSFIMSAGKQIADSEGAVVFDLSPAPVAMMSQDIFEALKEKGSGRVAVKTKNGMYSFDATELYSEAPQEIYDFTLQQNGEHAANTLPSMAKYDNFVVSTNTRELPGNAYLSIYTTFPQGTSVSVYIYDPEEDGFVTLTSDVTVADGGVVTFRVDRGGEFIISTMSGFGDGVYRPGTRGIFIPTGRNTSMLVIAGAMLLLGLLTGIVIGRGIRKKKNPASAKTAGRKNEKKVPSEKVKKDVPEPSPEETTAEEKTSSEEKGSEPEEPAETADEGVIWDKVLTEEDSDPFEGAPPDFDESDIPPETVPEDYDDLSLLDRRFTAAPAAAAASAVTETPSGSPEEAAEEDPTPEEERDIMGEVISENDAVFETIAEEDQEGTEPALEEEAPAQRDAATAEEKPSDTLPLSEEVQGSGEVNEPSDESGKDTEPEEKKAPKKRGFFGFGRKAPEPEPDEDMKKFEQLLDMVNRGEDPEKKDKNS